MWAHQYGDWACRLSADSSILFTFFGKFLYNLLNFTGAFDFTDKWMLTQVTGVNSQPFLMELSGTLVPFLQSFDK